MIFGAQYYRPPFPESRYWKNDFRRMRDAGLNTVQLWLVWGWIEPEPGRYVWDDYDRLAEEAEAAGLQMVLSTIAAIHPVWIHDEEPGSEMVTNLGHRVVSTQRRECHFGLSPGGCIDHPGVRRRLIDFIGACGERYRGLPHLAGWDVWNELRWNRMADGLVCHCPHTLAAYREWLAERYKSVDELNRRRHLLKACVAHTPPPIEQVPPGKMPRSPYTHNMAFQEFMTERANRFAAERYRTLKAIDPSRPVTVHGGHPTFLHAGADNDYALWRGNDWRFSEEIDGIGTSSFPYTSFSGEGAMELVDFVNRIDATRSARADKLVWLSELQGGRAANGFDVHGAVPASDQQRWVWTGIGNGASAILFWCWRDEVFGKESAGFGFAGADGKHAERARAMRRTADVCAAHRTLLDRYQPCRPEVGVLFSPQSYYLSWSEERPGTHPVNDLRGYMRALTFAGLDFTMVEEAHLDALDALRLLILPRLFVMSAEVEERLSYFVADGGTILCESECGAFDPLGVWRYPEDRFLARHYGILDQGRRLPEASGERRDTPTLEVHSGHRRYRLACDPWFTPLYEAASSTTDTGSTALTAANGRVVALSTYLGAAFLARDRYGRGEEVSCDDQSDVTGHRDPGELPEFLCAVAGQAHVRSPIRLTDPDHRHRGAVRWGESDGTHLAIVVLEGIEETQDATEQAPRSDRPVLSGDPGFLGTTPQELLTGNALTSEKNGREDLIELPASTWGVWVVVQTECDDQNERRHR